MQFVRMEQLDANPICEPPFRYALVFKTWEKENNRSNVNIVLRVMDFEINPGEGL